MAPLSWCALGLVSVVLSQVDLAVGATCDSTEVPELASWFTNGFPKFYAVAVDPTMTEEAKDQEYGTLMEDNICTYRAAMQAAAENFNESACELDGFTAAMMEMGEEDWVLCLCTCPGIQTIDNVTDISASSPLCSVLACMDTHKTGDCAALMAGISSDDMAEADAALLRCGGGECSSSDLPGLTAWYTDGLPLFWAVAADGATTEEEKEEAYAALTEEHLCTYLAALEAAAADFDASVCTLDALTSSIMGELDEPWVSCLCTCPGMNNLGNLTDITKGSAQCSVLECMDEHKAGDCAAVMATIPSDDMDEALAAIQRCGVAVPPADSAPALGSVWGPVSFVALVAMAYTELLK